MNRSTTLFLLLTCPLLACGDDTTTPGNDTTGGESTTDATPPVTVTVNPTTMTTTEGTETTDSDSGVDSTSSTGMTTGTGTGTGTTDDTGTTAGEESSSGTTNGLMCGNGSVDMGEDCDGDDLGGATCETMGFAGGALACDGTCTYDTAACTSCGNDVIDGAEECDGIDLGGNGCADLGMGFTGGSLTCDGACTYDSASCTSVPWPVAGEVIITEIMQDPAILPDADGEFFEVYNPTMVDYQLANCLVEGSTDLGFVIDTDLEIAPLSYRIFAIDFGGDQGFTADYSWQVADFNLNNSSDTVRIVCDGIMVDEVLYDNGATFPDPTGASMNLDPSSYDAIANDSGANWCEGTLSYNGDFGTPGADNSVCAAPTVYPIDFCRLQFPDLIDEVQGTDVDVFGRLFSAGLTDLSGVNDPAPEVIGYVGYGPDGTDPAIDMGWVWTGGIPNAAYGPAAPGYEANNDEYTAVLSVPSPGDYDFAFRFTGDSGMSFTYCDGQPEGSSNGYAPADAGQMTSQMGGPPPPLYFSEYAEGSSNNKAFEIYNPPGADADLTACEVRFYFNGNVVVGNTVPLVGAIAADDVFVVCDDGIDAAVFDPMGCDILAAGSFFNGDDALELVCSGITLDVIGEIGFDPGAEWVVGGVGTQNETIRRDCTVTMGDANGGDVFDPSIEWVTFMQNDFSDFGQYVCP